MHRPWMRVLGSVFALSLLAACSSNDGGTAAGDGGGGATETSSPSAETGGGGGADLTIVDFAFSPKHLSVSDGGTITIHNIGDATHTFTTEDGSIDETVPSGEEIQVMIEGVSTQGFHCRFHSQMQGTLTVE
jgi:plastocyanin